MIAVVDGLDYLAGLFTLFISFDDTVESGNIARPLTFRTYETANTA